ncbi:RidA family protein [Variovorax sp. 770b2]|uniref:RidA family protein n=1 Tax=Variovorax sp. 770b2 TaxID=1566271 RepID=UPI0008EFBABD|nr:RidA family protein [Variovorax sp. 770b2]SFP38634.1 Enamine deaminase RidA, house cleaning of reactive enamine intermediates, YjgF/YER057c/UK114 family [Variovorax sp. 770b2]
MRDAIIPIGMEHFHTHYHFAPAVRAGGLLFLSGQLGIGSDLTLADGIAAQIDLALHNLGQVLEAAGRSYADVVEINSFHVGPLGEHMPLFVEALARFFTAPYPAWTSVEVAGLALPGAQVEIKATALA